MRILAISSHYPPHHSGGYGLRCKEVLEGLRRKGHEIELLTDQCPDDQCDQYSGEVWISRVLELKPTHRDVFSSIRSDIQELLKIETIIKTFQPDLLYLWHTQNLSDAIFPFLSRQGIPIVYDEGGSGLIYLARLQKRGLYFYKNEKDHEIKKWIKQVIKRFAQYISRGMIVPDWEWPKNFRIYFNSHSALEHAREMGVPTNGAAVIPSGLDIQKFPFKDRSNFDDPLRIIMPTRIKEQKGCKDGIHLVEELRRRNINTHLLIVGEVQAQDYHAELVALGQSLGLDKEVSIQPMMSQEELSELYRQSDMCFFPTHFKTGFSRVPLEAMASGCLVITYGNEASKEVVQDNLTGFIVPEGDVNAAAQKIEDLANAPNSYVNITKSARDEIENKRSLEQYIDEIEAYLMSSLNPAG